MHLVRAALLVALTGAFLPGHAQDTGAVAGPAAAGTPFVYSCSWLPHPPASERLVIDLVLATEPPGTEVTITLTNTTDARIGYNLCHAELERLRGDEWTRVRPMLHPVCTDFLLRLDPGAADSLTFRLAPDEPSGQYRVRAHLLNGEPKPVVSNVFAVTPRGRPTPTAPVAGSP